MKSNDTFWRKAVLTADATMQAVIQNMNMSTLRIALVVNEQGALVGTICDGDIRRGLLRGLDLNLSLIHI